jgi:ATP-dependent Clp protease ATP-binding subunit ClpC
VTRPAFRVFVTTHHGGLCSAVLLRRYRQLFDPPPPAAMAADVETALGRLAPQAALLVDNDEAERYVWTEQLELRRVEVEIHPGRPDPRGTVITGARVPIRLGYAAAKIEGAPLYRVLIPRFDWTFVTEQLATVPDTIRALVFASLTGDSSASLYDLRREVDEAIVEWRPIEAPLRGAAAASDASEPVPANESSGLAPPVRASVSVVPP